MIKHEVLQNWQARAARAQAEQREELALCAAMTAEIEADLAAEQ